MTILTDKQKLKARLAIASLAIEAEAASLTRRYAQSDYNTIAATGKRPSRKKLAECEIDEREAQRKLRVAIYDLIKAFDADAAVRAGLEPEPHDHRGHNAQMLANHLP